EREFLVFQGRSYGYRETARQVERAAAMYAARGVKAGDRVGVMSLNHPSTVFTILALARLGAIMAPVNPDYGVEEARYVLTHAQVSGVLSSPSALATVREACRDLAPSPWFMVNEPGDADTPVFAAELERAGAGAPEDGSPGSTCVFIYTSGTTGFPKGVMHSQRNVILAGEGFVERMYLQPSDRLLCILPMFHVNAIFYSLAGSLAAGATLILEPRFSASRFWPVVRDTGATEVNTIAAVMNILMRRPRSEFVPGHRLRKLYGGPFSEEIYRIFQQEFGVETLIEGYGMSEVPGVLNNPFEGPHKIGSMGKPSRHPNHGMAFSEMRVVDDDGEPVPDGQVGELVVRTPIVMQGYYRDPEQTAAAFRGDWFITGDLGRRDQDGYFWFVARKKDIIRRRGENISGAELDRVVSSHPEVMEAAAIPVPSELGEDEILVVVVRKPDTELTAEEIAEWCRERLAAIKVPRYVVFADSLPHTPTHRVAKFKLREDTTLRSRAIDLTGPR
ncbi:MAG TPA: AMP-binding protein, partial [Microvirga sp.]|nr:AMP-binding protein [Microvirga sp.]